ncbi:PKD domain-containing protein [Saccharicrinis fermentans]|nr:PKD domain-containing protein [Saccharicrinis fermentans]
MGKCAPVDVDWEATYYGVNDKGTATIQIQYDWNDGSPVELVNATLIDATNRNWQATHSHTYPNTGNQCNYHPRVALVVNGIVCTSSEQEQIVTVWDTDNQNGGYLSIAPDPKPICFGNDALFQFEDISQWNCTPPDENDAINNADRWVQWIYGTGGSTITNAQVDGSVHTYPWTGSINYVPGPVESPIAPYNTTLDIYIPNGHPVGAFFEVTLRNWNVCNPYDANLSDGLPPADPINGDFPPVTTTARAIIVDLPDASVAPVAAICASEAPFLLIASDGGGQWSGPGISDPSNAMFNPQTAGPGIHTITYAITDGNACSDIGSVTIEVLESPKASIAQGDTAHLCPGMTIALDGNSTLGTAPYTHSWSGQTTGLSNTNIDNPDFTSTSGGLYELIYRVEDQNTCWNTDTIIMDIQQVNISITNPDIEVCQGNNITLNPEPSGGSEFYVLHQWTGTRTDKLSATDIQTPVFTANETGTFTYLYTVHDSHGCENTQTIKITVHGQPSANPGNHITECGLQSTLTATPSIGLGSWKTINGPGNLMFSSFSIPSPDITANTYGDYTLRWTEENNGCTDSADIIVSFTEIPLPSVMQDKDTCGLSIQLSTFKHVGTGIWKMAAGIGTPAFDDAALTQTNVTVDIPGKYKFTWNEDNGNGCIGNDTVEINFLQIPIAQIALPMAGCTPLEINFTNTSSYADSYHWDFGNGIISNQENPQQIFTNHTAIPVDYEITFIARTINGCADTVQHTIEVAPTPVSLFEIDKAVGCSPLESKFTNQSPSGNSYEWIWGDGSSNITTTNASHTFKNNETYTQSFKVELISKNTFGCTDTSKIFTTVYPKQKFNLMASPDSGCAPLNVNFIGDIGAYQYEWDFGDGNHTLGGNIHSKLFTNNEQKKEKHLVTLYTTSGFGCLDTAQVSIITLPSPTAEFVPNDFAICSPKNIVFDNNSEHSLKSFWDFGDGNTANTVNTESIDHSYINNTFSPINYKIRLVTENSFGCKDSMDGFTTVNPSVAAKITGDGKGCAPMEISFGNESIGANNFVWNYGDGHTSTSYLGLNVFTNNTTTDKEYKVSMIASSPYGCTDTAHSVVTIYATPDANFTVTPEEVQMPESTIEINNLTLGNNWLYQWEFGDSNTSSQQQPIQHTYADYGLYDVSLKVYSEKCENTLKKGVRIKAGLPTVEYGPPTQGCPALKVDFFSNATSAENYYWDFGDGNISASPNPTHTYFTEGTYTVTLSVEGPGGTTTKNDLKIDVYPEPTALFEVRPNIVTIPGEGVTFINQSINADTYLWNFGNGQTSTLENPIHEYSSAGNFDIRLQAENQYGCSNSYIQYQAVTAKEGGEITFPNAFTPNTAGPGDGRYDRTDNNNFIFHPAVAKGVVEYKLQIFTRWGQLIFESNQIEVGWNGYHKNQLCIQGVYIWKVSCRFSTGQFKVYTGDVTLLR